jgi:hypothetical protein
MDDALLAAAVAALAARLPSPAEPPAAAVAAEAWRQAWRPAGDRLRVLLLAESHMATAAEELACPVLLPPGLDWPAPEPPRFLRHVYCPAYGESALAPGLPPRRKNLGTPPYWRLLAACEGAATPGLPLLRKASNPGPGPRLEAKAALLRRLRARGIWLTDASLPALAGPGVPRAGPARIRAALELSWDLYHGRLLPRLDPARVVVVGREVARVLGGRLDAAFPGRWTVVRQPTRATPSDWAAMTAAIAEACARFAPPPPAAPAAAAAAAAAAD